MAQSFQDFEVHKKGVALTKFIFELMKNKNFDREAGFENQLKRTVVSITNNIAEGSEYNSNKQFVRYLKMSKGSCAEVRNMLILAAELHFVSTDEVKYGYDLTIEISQNIANFIKYLNNHTKD